MLKIQVTGKGMIPRGYGLAPRLEPFFADLTFISTILNTNGLGVRFLNPVTNQFSDLTKANVKKMYEKYANMEYSNNTPVATTHPHIPDEKKQVVNQNPANVSKNNLGLGNIPKPTEVMHTNPPQYVTPKAQEQNKPAESTKTTPPSDHTKSEAVTPVVAPVEEKKEEQPTGSQESIKPVNAPQQNNQQNNQQHSNNYQNKSNNNGKK